CHPCNQSILLPIYPVRTPPPSLPVENGEKGQAPAADGGNLHPYQSSTMTMQTTSFEEFPERRLTVIVRGEGAGINKNIEATHDARA
ncbi:hypothetical protein, partial [Mesorhizobium sp.]|uniref:hypothetical protein n=1 Tax=Mesorhizobium sp. TaxID=1871066 RepID=UPI00257CA7D4